MAQKETKAEGKEQGLSLGRCFAKAKLYSREVPGKLPYLYIIPFFLAYLVLDLTVRGTYHSAGIVGLDYLPAALFTLGWALIFSGLVFALPTVPKWIVRCVPLVTFVTICVTHSGFMSMFGHFFSFSVLKFSGTAEFFDASYISIDWRVVLGAAVTVLLMMISGRLLQVVPPKLTKKTVIGGLVAAAAGLALVIFTANFFLPTQETVRWITKEKDQPAVVYQNFTDPTNCVMVCGVYQYSIKDLWIQIRPEKEMSEADKAEVQSYIQDYEAKQTDNDFTGRFAGKNVIMVQLEAVDTWLIDPDYMPNLCAIKDKSIRFNNHYTPLYITAATFNTEFQVHSGFMPATGGGVSTSAYYQNSFPYSLPNLFNAAGYTSRSFHNFGEETYNRGLVHPNLGYESYTTGEEMKMKDTSLDRYLINGFDSMTEGDPFFSTIITYSTHGTYGPDNVIYKANKNEAIAAAKLRHGNYVYAVAGAMETDRFVGELVQKLEESGHMDDTVLVFYADHYDYYFRDDEFLMELKGVDNLNMIRHTDFFIYSQDQEPMDVDKVTTSMDILPTLANLFGLDTIGAFLVGHDAMSDQGGYVYFQDGSWYDGTTYWDSTSGAQGDPERRAEIDTFTRLSNQVFSGDYYAAIAEDSQAAE